MLKFVKAASNTSSTMNETSLRHRSRSAKPSRSLGTEQRPDNDCAESGVNRQLPDRVKHAQAYVEQDPCKRQPPRPLLSHQQSGPADRPRKLSELDRDRVRMPSPQLRKVRHKSDHSHKQVEGGDHNHRPRSLIFAHRTLVCRSSVLRRQESHGDLHPRSAAAKTVSFPKGKSAAEPCGRNRCWTPRPQPSQALPSPPPPDFRIV